MLDYKNKPNVQSFIDKYGAVHPLLNDFEKTEQDPVWHAEGHVKIHTDWVLECTYKLIETHPLAMALTDQEKQILMFAAAYHDYAKPITTKEDFRNGRICVVASGHEVVGASLLLHSQKPDELSAEDWLLVIKLVCYHQMPKKMIRDESSKGEYIKLLRHCGDTRLLYLLEVADMEGRTCNDLDDELTFLELFKELCIEYGVFCHYDDFYRREIKGIEEKIGCAATYRGLSDMAEGKIHDLDTIQYMNYSHENRPTIYVMCGLAGSGKSTYIKNQLSGKDIISLDDLRKKMTGSSGNQSANDEVRRVAMEDLRVLLRKGEDVVYDATSYRSDFRTAVTDLAHAYGYASKIVMVVSTVDGCLKNISKRDRKVEREVIEGQFNSFQIPNLSEAEEIDFVLPR